MQLKLMIIITDKKWEEWREPVEQCGWICLTLVIRSVAMKEYLSLCPF